MVEFWKEVDEEELSFYIRADKVGITPKLNSSPIEEYGYISMYTERFDMNLREYMNLPESDITEIILSKCSALYLKLHEIGIQHGDVSLYNIVVKLNEEDDIYRLIDFGMSFNIDKWIHYIQKTSEDKGEDYREVFINNIYGKEIAESVCLMIGKDLKDLSIKELMCHEEILQLRKLLQ